MQTFDFSALYTTISNSKLKNILIKKLVGDDRSTVEEHVHET